MSIKLSAAMETTAGFSVRSVVDHGVMGRGINLPWWTHRSISRFSLCSTTSVTKAVVFAILFVGRLV